MARHVLGQRARRAGGQGSAAGIRQGSRASAGMAAPGVSAHPPAAPERLLGSTGLALIGAIAAVATLVTPFAIDTWRYVIGLASNPAVSGRVSEWRPPWPLDPAGLLFYLSVLAVLVVVGLRLRADGFRRAH